MEQPAAERDERSGKVGAIHQFPVFLSVAYHLQRVRHKHQVATCRKMMDRKGKARQRRGRYDQVSISYPSFCLSSVTPFIRSSTAPVDLGLRRTSVSFTRSLKHYAKSLLRSVANLMRRQAKRTLHSNCRPNLKILNPLAASCTHRDRRSCICTLFYQSKQALPQ